MTVQAKDGELSGETTVQAFSLRQPRKPLTNGVSRDERHGPPGPRRIARQHFPRL